MKASIVVAITCFLWAFAITSILNGSLGEPFKIGFLAFFGIK